MKKALFLGIIGSFFFAFTFIFNRSMNLSGGYPLWMGLLRYLITLPILFLLLLKDRRYLPVIFEIRRAKYQWLLWSSVGFGLFYAPLTIASVYAESWFTAAVWQFTIVAGVLLTPLFGKKIPVKNVLSSCVIVAGIFLMQISHLRNGIESGFIVALLLIVIAAFSYPLGNRKIMAMNLGKLTTLQRVFGMTLCSMPFWLFCGIFAMIRSGLPSSSQCIQSFFVALFSGVIATLLFFKATDIVKDNPKQLAVVEATQCGEVIFTVLLGVLFLKDSMPTPTSLIGIVIILVGMVANSLLL